MNDQNLFKKLLSWSSVFMISACALFLTSCFQTRAQLKQDALLEKKPVPIRIESVKEQNQPIIESLKTQLSLALARIENLEQKEKKSSLSPQTISKIQALQKQVSSLENTLQTLQKRISRLELLTPPRDPVELFQKGKKLFLKKKYPQAIIPFSQYLSIAPTSGKRRAKSIYYQAEIYFALKKFKKAILTYSSFTTKYPKHKWNARSLYKIGLSFEALHMKTDAKPFYVELIEKHRRSFYAKKAKKRLRRIRKRKKR